MRLTRTPISFATAVTALLAAAVSTAATPPVAALPGVVVGHRGVIYVEGRPIGRGAQPTWSPDGRRIAFVRAGDVYVADRNGKNARRLTRTAQPEAFPAWSPDGRTIAFGGVRDVYSVSSSGGPVKRLTRSAKPWLIRTTPAFSPDGRLIAISATTDAYNSDIFVMRADGKNLRRLTRSQGTHDRHGEEQAPDWSPDGKWLVYTSNRNGRGDLYLIGVDGKNEQRVTRTPRVDETFPRFNRDARLVLYAAGGRIAYVQPKGGLVREIGLGETADWR